MFDIHTLSLNTKYFAIMADLSKRINGECVKNNMLPWNESKRKKWRLLTNKETVQNKRQRKKGVDLNTDLSYPFDYYYMNSNSKFQSCLVHIVCFCCAHLYKSFDDERLQWDFTLLFFHFAGDKRLTKSKTDVIFIQP